ncbi:MAG: hypothetical protein KDD51_02460 [Bdellovibrionales bacterium]|nr:hypothetical protein [Bdellovibrionales bacterium]
MKKFLVLAAILTPMFGFGSSVFNHCSSSDAVCVGEVLLEMLAGGGNNSVLVLSGEYKCANGQAINVAGSYDSNGKLVGLRFGSRDYTCAGRVCTSDSFQILVLNPKTLNVPGDFATCTME